MTAAIALFYVVFAFENASLSTAVTHGLIASVFLAVAIVGARTSMWWVVLALAGHGTFDALAHLFANDPSPEWWGPFCLGVDVVLSGWLAALLITRSEAEWK